MDRSGSDQEREERLTFSLLDLAGVAGDALSALVPFRRISSLSPSVGIDHILVTWFNLPGT